MGTEFNGLFDEWAHTYDSFVQGEDIQYKEVFAHYEDILEDVVNKSFGNVLEFGVGTGNLTNKLLLVKSHSLRYRTVTRNAYYCKREITKRVFNYRG